MKIEKIKLENFRGFEGEHTIELHPQLNVFVGRNGAGKSSVLDALGMLIAEFYKLVPIYDFRSYDDDIENHDINYSHNNSKISLLINCFFYDSNVLISESPIKDTVFITKSTGKERSSSLRKKSDIYDYFERYVNQHSESFNLSILRYFRKAPYWSATDAESDTPQFNAYENAFFENADFTNFSNWFIEEENEENRVKVKTRNLDYISPKLNALRTAIEKFFTYFPDSEFSELAGENEQDNYLLSPLTIKKNSRYINLNQLSDGEKKIILYVADIASRLSIANPGLEDTNQGYGVVLIDEIEAHLHPSWQRNIIPALTGTFPNIQFFMTTHSPQVITNVKRENIKIIEDFKIVENTPHSYGRDANNILYNIFGVEERLPQIQEKIDKLYDLIDDEKANGAAKKLMEEIKELLGEDDPEVQRANTYLEFNS